MAMSPLLKMQRSMEKAHIASEKAKQRKQDIQDLKDAGIWIDPREIYLDDYGYMKYDAPVWFRNLYKAWGEQKKINDELHERKVTEPTVKRKRKKNRFKYNKKPLRRGDEMRSLLEDHGIYVGEDNMLSDEFSEWRFCPNGRLQRADEPTISVFLFLDKYAKT